MTLLALLVGIILAVQAVHHTVDKETYDVLYELAQHGRLNCPVGERTRVQKNAIIRYWRNANRYLIVDGVLTFNGKPIIRQSDLHSVITHAFKESKGSGVRRLTKRLNDDSAALVRELSTRCCHLQNYIRD